ncbi:Pentapeptide repeat-containing protein [Streptomyces sp. WMMB 714]|uniref:pentapeptide repeat-containing protein n=1 Tax=Streptomyces sp. WMMB 714 TaxID=1286822 RepID=UPI0008237B32|nr:pentapeptide repeat-containing protein [Streptomyces sp. WMMB 714]SCK45636.1 Pentapeptide repeat-containing protein [Streptomyces sp. WMMB 714]
MTATTPAEPPPYPHCGRGAGTEDPVGCRGHRVPHPRPDGGEAADAALHGACLAHLDGSDRDTYLASLRPGSNMDHRGTTFDPALLAGLLDAVRDPADQRPRFGAVRFGRATFEGDAAFGTAAFKGRAAFDGATFTGRALFNSAVFGSEARFRGATFEGDAWFDGTTFESETRFDRAAFGGDALFLRATFEGDAVFDEAVLGAGTGFHRATFRACAGFDGATFKDVALFVRAAFEGDAWFDGAAFEGGAGFNSATFKGRARFDGTTFQDGASFDRAAFESASSVGPLACRGTLSLAEAVFSAAVTLEIAASRVDCHRTRWASTASLRLRHAVIDLSDAVLEFPVSVTAHDPEFLTTRGCPLDESGLHQAPVRGESLHGVDAAHLVLTNLNLAECRFSGTVHLDQLRMEGRCPFPLPNPQGIHWRRGLPVRHTQRLLLAEEQHWRHSMPRSDPGWLPAPPGADIVEPPALAALYRALRKSHEDSRNEPGAADFYYGEMEMRRADPTIAPAERGLLNLYWALSGYGLRAARAIAWLLAAMTATVLLMTGFGLPDSPARPYPRGAGVIGKQNPQLRADFPDRFTTARAQKAADVVINSVIFRSSGQSLTTAGRYTEMASRFAEPALLTLALLAIRGRLKR